MNVFSTGSKHKGLETRVHKNLTGSTQYGETVHATGQLQWMDTGFKKGEVRKARTTFTLYAENSNKWSFSMKQATGYLKIHGSGFNQGNIMVNTCYRWPNQG